jgi:Skp family chaperone for outer membrane proteins
MDETIEQFEQRISQTIADLNASVEQMQKETAEDMAEMKANLQAEINKVLADLDAKSKEMDQEFADLLEKVNKQVTELQDKIQDDIDQMLQDVDNSILSDAQVKDLMDQINANINAIDGNGVVAASFETYSSVVVVDTAVSEVSIAGLGATVNSGDKLFVHINSVYLVENVDYRIDANSQKIICLTGTWNSYNIPGCEFAFDLIKKITTIE